MDFHAFCTKYGVENIQNEELRDFYGHNFRGSCTKRARMRRFLERFIFRSIFFDRFGQNFNEISQIFEHSSKAPYLRPISARDTGDMPTKFAQATYSNLNTPNMEWNFRWRAKNMDGWIFCECVKNPSWVSLLDFLRPPRLLGKKRQIAKAIHSCGGKRVYVAFSRSW